MIFHSDFGWISKEAKEGQLTQADSRKIALTKELKPVDWVEVETLPKTGKDDKTPAQTH